MSTVLSGKSPEKEDEYNLESQRRKRIKIESTKCNDKVGDDQQTLKLLGYHLSENIAKALGLKLGNVEFMFKVDKDSVNLYSRSTSDFADDVFPKEFQNLRVKVLMLESNGLSDKGLSYILEGLHKQR